MEPVETVSVLDERVTAILRELAASTVGDIGRSMLVAQENHGSAYREGLRKLHEHLPTVEERLIALHLELGERDADTIAERISLRLKERVSHVAKGLVHRFPGSSMVSARRDAADFESTVGSFASGVPGRVRVAVEMQRRRDQAGGGRQAETKEPPLTHERTFADLLNHDEKTWLDWKGDFWAGIYDTKHADREQHRGKLMKALVSIANSLVDERGYLVCGVNNNVDPRTVVGIKKKFDDADFHDWNVRAFNPPVKFDYRNEEHGGKVVGIFEIMPASEYPHVCAQDFEGELHEGQVWFRRGSRNSPATHADLKVMFASSQPLAVHDAQPFVHELRANPALVMNGHRHVNYFATPGPGVQLVSAPSTTLGDERTKRAPFFIGLGLCWRPLGSPELASTTVYDLASND